ncbi:MAG: putative dehydrogenase [Chlamydiales bacterium]|jgi:predicted dehydrogenase
MNRLRIGMIGAGFNARFHVQSLVNVRAVDLGGVSSRTVASSRSLADHARELGVGDAVVFEDHEELAASDAIDAVWINCPNHARIETMEAVVRGNARRSTPLAGIACEKPLARTVAEARRMLELADEAGVPTGYLENMIFVPAVARGKEIIWRRGAANAGRPYLARAAEEHSGPHTPWFWMGTETGGGALLDMMCHGLETARWMLTEPGKPRASLTPIEVTARIDCLKWSRPAYVEQLKQRMGPQVDYAKAPSEDYANATVLYEDEQGARIVTESTTSWSFVGAGLRHSLEMLGPEYSMQLNTLDTGLSVFFSRNVTGTEGEDLVEKQNAEQGLMPVVPEETSHYGYVGENRHFAQAFMQRKTPALTFHDGHEIMRILAACYMSAETGRTVDMRTTDLSNFEPAVSRGTWRPGKVATPQNS